LTRRQDCPYWGKRPLMECTVSDPLPESAPPPVWTVSELNRLVKDILEQSEAGIYAFKHPEKQAECLSSFSEKEQARH
jgi:hypothetical protein